MRMHRRAAAAGLFAGLAGAANALAQGQDGNRDAPQADVYTEEEIVAAASEFFGTGAEAVASAVERIFADQGRPVGYIAGEELAGAVAFGLRYGQGMLFMRSGARRRVYWQGPSIGWDFGGNAARVFTLVYGLRDPDLIYRRYPGVEGSAYLVAGIGVNYQRAEGVTLAPMRAGVGVRAGANVGYLAYSQKRRYLPF